MKSTPVPTGLTGGIRLLTYFYSRSRLPINCGAGSLERTVLVAHHQPRSSPSKGVATTISALPLYTRLSFSDPLLCHSLTRRFPL